MIRLLVFPAKSQDFPDNFCCQYDLSTFEMKSTDSTVFEFSTLQEFICISGIILLNY